MKTRMWAAVALACAAHVSAQEAATAVKDSVRTEMEMKADTLGVPLEISVPRADAVPFGMYGIAPFDYGYASWELHKGFNASIGLSVTFSPSRFAPSGAGFGQDAAFMYAVPLTGRLSVAGGLYARNFNWGFIHCRDVGFAGVAAFKVNERISLYAYGNKSFMPKRAPYGWLMPGSAPDRLGGMVNFKLGESGSISFGVEGVKYPNGCYWR